MNFSSMTLKLSALVMVECPIQFLAESEPALRWGIDQWRQCLNESLDKIVRGREECDQKEEGVLFERDGLQGRIDETV